LMADWLVQFRSRLRLVGIFEDVAPCNAGPRPTAAGASSLGGLRAVPTSPPPLLVP